MNNGHSGPLGPSEHLREEKIHYHCRESNYNFQLSDQYPSPILTALSRLPRYVRYGVKVCKSKI